MSDTLIGPESLVKLQRIYSKEPLRKTRNELLFVRDVFEDAASIAYAESIAEKLRDKALEEFADFSAQATGAPYNDTAVDAIKYLVGRTS